MTRHSRLLAVLGSVLVLAAATTAEARNGSVKINEPGVRKVLGTLAEGGSLRLTERLSGPSRGVSSLAIRKAGQTERGYNGFHYGAGAKSYVVNSPQGKLVVTTARLDTGMGSNVGPATYFVARDGASGIVVGRGYVKADRIVWTRSKNERGMNVPSERNAAGK